MRIGIIGAGISGIAAAHYCQAFADVTLYEANPVLGGHTDTHDFSADGRTYSIDSGFIVFNDSNYPLFTRWLDELRVAARPTVMSFGVSLANGLEYGTSDPGALFCQRRNLVRPGFIAMLRDIRRFYRRANELFNDHRTLGELFADGDFSAPFVDWHLGPMCAAIWSAPGEEVNALPVAHVATFMANHGLMQLRDRPAWRVVKGGSRGYIDAFEERFRGTVRKSCPVRRVERDPRGDGASVHTDRDTARFDYVVLACHGDDALQLIDPTPLESAVLGSFRYRSNHAVVHSDASAMPRTSRAWSSWNVHATDAGDFEFTYWMNRLQGIVSRRQFFVTLNPRGALDTVWAERHYRHPVFDWAARAAQASRRDISVGRTRYCGAYWGWGFHEDGFRSGYEVAMQLEQARRA